MRTIFIVLVCMFQWCMSDQIDDIQQFIRKEVNAIIDSEFEAIKCCGLRRGGGGASCVDRLNTIRISAYSSERPNIDRARYLAVHVADDILRKANSNLRLKRFFKQSPLSSQEIDVSIYFKNVMPDSQEVMIASVFCGKVRYSNWDRAGKFVELHAETYEEAWAKLLEQSKAGHSQVALKR